MQASTITCGGTEPQAPASEETAHELLAQVCDWLEAKVEEPMPEDDDDPSGEHGGLLLDLAVFLQLLQKARAKAQTAGV